MSGIARILLERGVQVSGSDLALSHRTRSLEQRGARIFQGHSGAHLGEPDLVVVSSAVPPDNPEWTEAVRRGIPVWTRGRMLAELTRGFKTVAVAGTHGKTTTTSMIGYSLEQAGLDPTVVIGGELAAFGSNARCGRGPCMVVEADESDRSFLLLSPAVAVVTNIEEDHLENYGDIDEIEKAFAHFLERVPSDGLAVLCGEDPRLRRLAAEAGCSVVTYGLSESCRYRASHVQMGAEGSTFRCWRDGRELTPVSLRVPGLHNILNALAALAVGVEMGVPARLLAEALGRFRGAGRRFEVIGEARGVLIVDDYAHHPTEIRATLAAARLLGRPVTAVFQPHRYSRTQKLYASFRDCFHDADRLIVTDIYPAGEKPIPGVTAARLAADIRRASGRPVQMVAERERIARELVAQLQPGDVVVTLGAGDIRKTALELHDLLSRPEEAWMPAPRPVAVVEAEG